MSEPPADPPPADDDLWSRRPDPFAKGAGSDPEPTAPYGSPYGAGHGQPPPTPYYQPQSTPPYGPYGGPPPGFGAAPPPNDGLGVAAMVVGIVSLVLMCGYGVGLLGSPVALFMGRASMKRIDRSQGRLGGRGMAQAGFILGIIGTVLLVLAIALLAFGLFAVFHWGDAGTTFDTSDV